jgi:hypothetical protein
MEDEEPFFKMPFRILTAMVSAGRFTPATMGHNSTQGELLRPGMSAFDEPGS